MTTYSVAPLPDGVEQRGSWQVKAGGRRVSTHLKKSAAKRMARRKAGSGDELVIMRTDGTIQKRRSY